MQSVHLGTQGVHLAFQMCPVAQRVICPVASSYKCIVTFLDTVAGCHSPFIVWKLLGERRTVTGRIVTFLDTVTGRCETFLDGIHLGGCADEFGVIDVSIGVGTQQAMLDQPIERGTGDPELAGRGRLGMAGHGWAYASRPFSLWGSMRASSVSRRASVVLTSALISTCCRLNSCCAASIRA